MAQKVVFIFVENELSEEILSFTPDKDELIQAARDMEYETSENDTGVNVQFEWYDIGEGESDTDIFFSDKELYQIMKNRKQNFQKEIEQRGFLCECYYRYTDRCTIVFYLCHMLDSFGSNLSFTSVKL